MYEEVQIRAADDRITQVEFEVAGVLTCTSLQNTGKVNNTCNRVEFTNIS